ncbi:hypothetical protein FAES_2614 [Fibrella aestuarina BUZ 2]|uniref:DUF4159 domain-containing protein n=1 Tax=Fibrella aestuarina BUZ 2 TaxID=1166018 RepID=I0K920_9BACT|nr:DUF4159 domain-containing protein [Fibrella aestuarina]CCH00623.1 hypothetical protein FAES_2614 [Fibrella aestuarina BUZ 2]
MNRFLLFVLIVCCSSFSAVQAQPYAYRIAKLKYNGGGDWYSNKTSLPNLIKFANQQLRMNIFPEEDIVDAGSPDLFSYPFVHMTGHGNVLFSEGDVQNMRRYLMSGGFLHVDDNYGLDKFIRREMKRVFPELSFVELPFTHPIYNQKFKFPNGLPKVHEHDGKAPQGFGLIYQGRLVCFYSYECDLGNGWEDQAVYNDPESARQAALRMGANLLQYATTVVN